MFSRSKRQSDAHWSKEYIEHLRTIHFALTAVCCAILILLMSNETYNVREARQELGKIISIRNQWSGSEFNVYQLIPHDDLGKPPHKGGLMVASNQSFDTTINSATGRSYHVWRIWQID